jgi:UDP-N-acetylglucosamine transferase subunit ALG13
VIFVTVGAQMPFDRLVRAVDAWAAARNRDDLFAQIGESEFQPNRLKWAHLLDPAEFKQRYEASQAIIAHAGTGSIIAALQLGKPIVIMPRHSSLMETRNDHQIATAKRFRHYPGVAVAWNESELPALLDGIDAMAAQPPSLGAHASPELLQALRDFVGPP